MEDSVGWGVFECGQRENFACSMHMAGLSLARDD